MCQSRQRMANPLHRLVVSSCRVAAGAGFVLSRFPVARSLFIFVFGLLVGQGTGLVALVEPEVCTDTCPGDDTQGTCPPLCADCTCCSHTSRTLAAGPDVAAGPLPSASLPSAPEAPIPSSAEPRDILHVPRSL